MQTCLINIKSLAGTSYLALCSFYVFPLSTFFYFCVFKANAMTAKSSKLEINFNLHETGHCKIL